MSKSDQHRKILRSSLDPLVAATARKASYEAEIRCEKVIHNIKAANTMLPAKMVFLHWESSAIVWRSRGGSSEAPLLAAFVPEMRVTALNT